MIGFFGFGYAYPVSFCEIQIHFLVGKPGEDKGHVGVAQMIFQRLEAETLCLFQAKSEQIRILFERQMPEILISPEKERFLALLHRVVPEQCFLPDLGEEARRESERDKRNDIIGVGIIMKVRIRLSVVPFSVGLVIRGGKRIYERGLIPGKGAAEPSDDVGRGGSKAVPCNKEDRVLRLCSFETVDIFLQRFGAASSAFIKPVQNRFDVRDGVLQRCSALEHGAEYMIGFPVLFKQLMTEAPGGIADLVSGLRGEKIILAFDFIEAKLAQDVSPLWAVNSTSLLRTSPAMARFRFSPALVAS